MKLAICLQGLSSGKNDKGDPVAFIKSYEYLKKNILDKNDVDIFVHSWSTDLKEEILEATQEYMARNAPRAAVAIAGGLVDPTELGIRDKLAAAKELLDRTGLVKTEKMQVEATGGVMLMPPKEKVDE